MANTSADQKESRRNKYHGQGCQSRTPVIVIRALTCGISRVLPERSSIVTQKWVIGASEFWL
jgi:hypothetical protein